MQKVAIALYNYIHRKYIMKTQRKSDEIYSRQIELEMGETINLKGISVAEQKNKIKMTLSCESFLREYLSRPGNLIFIVMNIICLSIIDLKLLDFSIIYQFVVPLLVGIVMQLIKFMYQQFVKHHQDLTINRRQVNVFRKLKKLQVPKVQYKRDIVGLELKQVNEQNASQKLKDSTPYAIPYKPIVISSFRGEDKKLLQNSQPEIKIPTFETISWEQLSVGDIVFLQRNELSPADLLILECNSDHCTSDVTHFTGNTNDIVKTPNILTAMPKMHQFKNNCFEYKLLLNCKVNFDRHPQDKSLYTGFVRLKNDPQAIDIKKENILFREQILQSCDYIYGLVLFAGLDCRYYYQLSKERQPKSFFQKKIDRFFQFTLLLLIVVSIASWMIESLKNEKWVFETLCIYLLNYLNMIPYYLYFLSDFKTVCSMLIKQIYFEKSEPNQEFLDEQQQQQVSFTVQSLYQRINDTPLADLCLIDSVILDKTGTITIPMFKLKMVNINETLYFIKSKSFKNGWQQYKNELQDINEMNQILKDESLSPIKQVSTVRISPCRKPMMSIPKKLSLRPVKFSEQVALSNSETNNIELCNPELEMNDEDHPRHHNFPDSWGSNEEVNGNPLSNKGSSPKIQAPNTTKRQTQIQSITLKRKPSMKLDRSRRFDKSIVFTKFIQDEYNSKQLIEEPQSLTEKDLYSKLINSESKKITEEMLYTLLLCHNTASTYSKQEDGFKHEFSSHLDRLQIELCNEYDHKFICSTSNKMKYIVEINGKLQEIPITVTQLEHYKLSVIINKQDYMRFFEESNTNTTSANSPNMASMEEQFEFVQLIRDDSQEMSNQILMDKEEKEKWDAMIYRIFQNGCRPVIYFKSFMDTAQYQAFIKNPLHETKTQSRPYELQWVIGVAEKVRKSAHSMIKNLAAADILIWIASGDTLEKVLPIAYKTEILKDINPIIHFDQSDPYLQIKQQMQWLYNNQIKSLKDEPLLEKRTSDRVLSPQNKRLSIHSNARRQSTKGLLPLGQDRQKIKPFSVLIHGMTLEKIEQDPNLLNHLAFILSFSTSVVGYRMTKHQKAIFVHILQQKYAWRRKVLAIGDEFNDGPMMSIADYSVQLMSERFFQSVHIERVQHFQRQKKEPNQYKQDIQKYKYPQIVYVNVVDIVVKDFKNLLCLLFNESRKSAELLENLIIFGFYRSYLMCFTLFFLNAFNNSSIIYPPLDYFQSVLFIIPALLMYYLRITRSESLITNIKAQLVYFYNQNQLKFRQIRYWLFFYKVILYSGIEGLLIAITLSYEQFINNDGKTLDLNMQSIQVFAQVLLLEVSKLLTHSNLLQFIVYFLSYFGFCIIGYLDYFDNNIEEEFQFFISIPSFFVMVSIQLTFYCIQKTLIQFHSIYFNEDAYTIEQQIEINSMIKPIQIYNSRKNRESLILNIQKYILKLFKNEDETDSVIRQVLQGMTLSVTSIKIHQMTQQFKNAQLELKYQLNELPGIIEYYRLYYPISWMLVEGAILIQIWLINTNIDYSWFLYFSLGYNAAQVLMAVFIYTDAFQKYHFRISKIIIICRLVYKIVYDAYFYQDNNNQLSDMLIMQLFMLQPLIDDRPLTITLYCFIVAISFMIRFSSNNTTKDDSFNNYVMLNYYLIALMQTALSSGMYLKGQRNSREEYLSTLALSQKTNNISDTLSILMPRFIRNMINQKGEFDIEENQGEVAILFCDICQFDNIIKTEKENIIHLLDILFRQYDSLCSQYGLQKIETVGKTYMAAAGLKNITEQNQVNPVLRTIQAAFEMQKFAKQQNFGASEEIIVKIGVHYGNVIAGVIGYHKPQFSLIGDTVNTTSRVCSTGQDGQIKISEEAYRLVNGSQDFIFTKDIVPAKGKGLLITYILQEQQHKIQKHKKPNVNSFKNLSKQSTKLLDKNNRSFKRKPTLILPHLKQNQNTTANSNKLQHKSSLGIESHNLPSHGDSDHVQQPQKGTVDGQNLIEVLELKLQKELLIEENGDLPQSLIDASKLKLMHQYDDEYKEVEVLILDRKKLFLDFHSDVDPQDIKQFYQELMETNTCIVILLKIGVAILLMVQNTSTILISSIFENQITWLFNLTFGYIIVTIKLIFFSLLINKNYRNYVCQEKYFIISYIITMLWWIIHILSYQTDIVGEICIAIGIFLSFMTQLNPIIQMKYKVLESLVMIIVNLIVILVKEWDQSLIYYAILLQIIFLTTQIYKFRTNVKLYNNKCKIKAKHAQLDQLVKHQLPSHMLDQFLKLQSQRAVLKDSYDDVTLLFADIAGFTEYSSHVSPEKVVFMLRNLFTEFDKCCQERGVYKLYTIGDCYVVMGMMDAKDRHPDQEAKNTVELGFEMINIIKRVRDNIQYQGLDMRIGIHTGNIIGGVLGTEIVRYDIYGPDVLIANKMESKGERGKLQVSQSTKDLLEQNYPDDFKYFFHTTVELPSIDRSTNGYFINYKNLDEPSMDMQVPSSDRL